jgi:hypothetical protein
MTSQGPCRSSAENKPINGFQGPLHLAEVQDRAANSGPMSLLVGVQGEAQLLQPA